MTEGRGQELLGTQIGAPGSTQLPLLEGGLAKARAGILVGILVVSAPSPTPCQFMCEMGLG